jgi:hypothetical protein
MTKKVAASTRLKRGALGNLPQEVDPRDFPYPFLLSTLRLPNEAILLEKAPPLYNQLKYGACTAFAADGVVEYTQNEEGNSLGELSHFFTYGMARFLQGTFDQDSGATNRITCKALCSVGYVPKNLFPYVPENFTKKPSKEIVKAAEAHRMSSKAYFAVGGQRGAFNHQAVKSAIANANPVIFGFPVKPPSMRQAEPGA